MHFGQFDYTDDLPLNPILAVDSSSVKRIKRRHIDYYHTEVMYKLAATQELSAKFSVMSVKNEKLNKNSAGEKVLL